MKINRLFSIAAATMMMVACSSEDTALKNTPAAGPQMQFTATIAAPGGGATTRTEYTEDTQNKKITVAWKVDDEIALIHDGVKDVATVKTVNDDGSATITGIITNAKNGEGVEVCYPAALWDWDDNTKGAIRNATFVTNIGAQGGTLNYIQENLDVRMAKGELKVDGDVATLAANVTLKSQIAIWKLTLQDDAETPAALSANQVTVKVDGTTPVTIASTTEDLSKTSTVYLALDMINKENLTIEATVDEDTYVYTPKGVSLARGNYYQSTVTMEKKAVDPAKAYLKWNDGQKTLVATEIPAGATMAEDSKEDVEWAGTYVVEEEVTINGTIKLGGDVDLIIKDGAKLTVNGYISGNSKNLSIYGQANQTGQLVVNCSYDDAIYSITKLEVHSCQVKATSSYDDCGGFYKIGTFNVYGGSVDAENTSTDDNDNGYGIELAGLMMNIYGGEVKAVGKRDDYGITCMSSSNVTVYGGKLWAENADNQAIYSYITLSSLTGKIETSDDGNNWAEWRKARTPTSKYVRVGY